MLDTKEKLIMNPISDEVIDCIKDSDRRLYIAVPFISPFAKEILDNEDVYDIKEKKLITKFDETNINTFDIPTLRYLLECGFEILFNNQIHLKLYITDFDAFVTSSNLTKGGFEKNIELTVKIDLSNLDKSASIFNKLWRESISNPITHSLLDKNLEKYEVLKKKQKYKNYKKLDENKGIESLNIKQSTINIEKLLDEILIQKNEYLKIIELSYEANKKRNIVKKHLKDHGFDVLLFYAPEGSPKRKSNLFYEFVYGCEEKLSGTGLREAQFKDVFEHKDFKNVINFIFPESIGLDSWDFNDDNSLRAFCDGLFDFDIPQYVEALPIRLASYFYPEVFLPIFKLEHLQNACDILGFSVDTKSKGERLFEYNSFLREIMKNSDYNNHIKGHMVYQIYYSVELYNKLEKGEDFNTIKASYKKKWKRGLIEGAKIILERIDAI